MAQLTLMFDIDTQTVISASIGGRALGAADISSVILAKGVTQVIDGAGRNLLEGHDEASLDHTKAQLDVAQAFGVDSPLSENGELN